MNLLEDKLYAQRFLSVAGFYKGLLDGEWGKLSKAAYAAFTDVSDSYRNKFGKLDTRSETNIYSMLPKAQLECRRMMAIAKEKFPLDVKVLSGTRSYAEQHKLFLQRPRVTKADAGRSNHNFGIAWDVGIFEKGRYFTGATAREEKAYTDLAKLVMPVMKSTLEWGGNWKSIVDKPHYQLVTGKSTSQCRALFEVGKPYT